MLSTVDMIERYEKCCKLVWKDVVFLEIYLGNNECFDKRNKDFDLAWWLQGVNVLLKW